MKPKDSINIRPVQYAAQLVEQSKFEKVDVIICPSRKDTSGKLREIVECRANGRKKQLHIYVRNRSSKHEELEQVLHKQSPFKTLTSVMEQELSLFGIDQALRERRHTLGLSPLQPQYFEIPGFLDDEQKKKLAFFLPYRSQIRGDRVLMSRCFQTALQQRVTIRDIDADGKMLPGTSLDRDCVLNSKAEVGGYYCLPGPCIEVIINQVSSAELKAWVPGGRQCRFLEEALLPVFTPGNWQWRVRIAVEDLHNECRIADGAEECRLGINTLIS